MRFLLKTSSPLVMLMTSDILYSIAALWMHAQTKIFLLRGKAWDVTRQLRTKFFPCTANSLERAVKYASVIFDFDPLFLNKTDLDVDHETTDDVVPETRDDVVDECL